MKAMHRKISNWALIFWILVRKCDLVRSNGSEAFQKDEFYDLIVNEDAFVDKSMLIAEILEDESRAIQISRPEGWGKTVNMQMIKRFFELEVDGNGVPLTEEARINKKLFFGGVINSRLLKPLFIANITDASKYHGVYPVVFLDLNDLKGFTYQELKNEVKLRILQLFRRHSYIRNSCDRYRKEQLERYYASDVDDYYLARSLDLLIELLSNHYKRRVLLLVDEYDMPIKRAMNEYDPRFEEFHEFFAFFDSLYTTLKSNVNLIRSVTSGTFYVPFESANNIDSYGVFGKKYAKFYGFTEPEVDIVLRNMPTKSNPNHIKSWYRGYGYGEQIIYNSRSIKACLFREGTLQPHMLTSTYARLIDSVLLQNDHAQRIQLLLEGKTLHESFRASVTFEDRKTPPNYFPLLAFVGYLKALKPAPWGDLHCDLVIPNESMRRMYVSVMREWVAKKLNIAISEYRNLLNLLVDGMLQEFGTKFREYFRVSSSFRILIEQECVSLLKTNARINRTATVSLLTKWAMFQNKPFVNYKVLQHDYHNLILGVVCSLASIFKIEWVDCYPQGMFNPRLYSLTDPGNKAIFIQYRVSQMSKIVRVFYSFKDKNLGAKEGLEQINQLRGLVEMKENAKVKKIIKISIVFWEREVFMEHEIENVMAK